MEQWDLLILMETKPALLGSRQSTPYSPASSTLWKSNRLVCCWLFRHYWTWFFRENVDTITIHTCNHSWEVEEYKIYNMFVSTNFFFSCRGASRAVSWSNETQTTKFERVVEWNHSRSWSYLCRDISPCDGRFCEETKWWRSPGQHYVSQIILTYAKMTSRWALI